MITLMEYATPEEFPSVLKYNFKQINNIQNDDAFNGLVARLSRATGIDDQVILLDLKRCLMTCQQLSPDYIKVTRKNISLFIYFIIRNIVRGMAFNPYRRAEIIIDDWYQGSLDTFYGKELKDKISDSYRCLFVNFEGLRAINWLDFVWHLPSFMKVMLFSYTIIRNHKIDLRRYIFTFFCNILVGLNIKRCCRPRIIISGNDNGVSVVKAKASQAAIILIQNAFRGYASDSFFKYGDYCISMGGNLERELRVEMGCVSKNTYSLGSLRLYNFFQKNKDKKFNIIYDLLWVGGWSVCEEDGSSRGGYYSMHAQRKAVQLINEFALKSNMRVSYHYGYDNEIDDLKKMGLFCDKVFYIARNEKNVYQSVMESEIVLSVVSTVCLESIALGKKIGLINFSGNDHLAYLYRKLGIEYNNNKNSFADFLEKITRQNFRPEDYIYQSKHYVDDLFSIINTAMNN